MGRGALTMRMFSEGFSQLSESWKRSGATGASETSTPTLMTTIVWLTGAMTAAIALCLGWGWIAAGIYLAYAMQLGWIAHRMGSFRKLGVLFYPAALLFYFALFGSSLSARGSGAASTWKGRQV